ncbi:MAG: hypothetical protein ABF274_10010 [Nonlabens sp.]|uniref:hypothetical protein n=1 Tax=Nonlabens sp. TaxID=1888209 RepID=UPI00321BE3AC
MKTARIILIASISNALFFMWIYMTHIYNITWTIAGVIHELLMIPMLLLAPVLFIINFILMFKKQQWKWYLVSMVISGISTVSIIWQFHNSFS